MSHNVLFWHEQVGFRIGHSTELAALQLTDYLIIQIRVVHHLIYTYIYIYIYIYIDLSKAFDTLDHSIVLPKFIYYGITDCANKLFVSYLSTRY